VSIAFRVVNVVATAELDNSVDLESLHELFPRKVIYDQEIYGGRAAYFKSADMHGKVTIFGSGKMISIGTKSEKRARRELRLVAKALEIGLRVEPTIRNIVATANLGFEPDLEKISSMKQMKVIYEPDQFPGAIIHMPLPSSPKEASILLFASGKLVCVGLKNLGNVHATIERLVTSIR
jgi:TATA-box binding protein (TBP) (component of TFIID and TFIIIB)